MFETSEDAIEANEPMPFEVAKREIEKHHMECSRHDNPAMIWVSDGCCTQEHGAKWEAIECTSRAILIWLGY